jgi:hypothetical protein
MVARSVVEYIAAPSFLMRISGGISFLSSGRATRTMSAPWSSSAIPIAFIFSTIGAISGSTCASPFHRSKCTPSAP